MTDTITLGQVSAASLKLLGEDVLVRAMAVEETRASGLIVPFAARESFGRGAEFYGVVVAVGPGRLVEKAPPVAAIRNMAVMATLAHFGHETADSLAALVGEAVADFVTKHTKTATRPHALGARRPRPLPPGLRAEVELREGRHHIVGRGNIEHGHGVIAAWTPGHAHCWHLTAKGVKAECSCGEVLLKPKEATRLPACSECPPGERLAEAVSAASLYAYKHAADTPVGHFEDRPTTDDGTEGK